MKKYLGVKIVDAEPMCEFDFLKFSDKGKAIVSSEYINRLGYKVTYEDGYVSWSPKEVFEKAYRLITGLTFGLAIEALKQGKKVARTEWIGKDAYLMLVHGDEQLSCIVIHKVNNILDRWLPDETSIFAEDWMIIE